MVKKLIREKNVAHIIIAALFSVSLIFGMSGVSLPLQQLQQEAYAQPSSPTQTTPSSSQMPPPTSICNSKPSTLKFGLKGAKVVELQSLLVKLGYKSLLGKGGVDGKFATYTQNAVKKFQQDHGLKPVNGIVTPTVLGKLCTLVKSVAPSPLPRPIQTQPIQIPVRYQNILEDLQKLALAAITKGNSNFYYAVISFGNELERQLKATDLSRPIPPSPLAITVDALNLWVVDTGKIWGTSDETADFSSTCKIYAWVKGSDLKCNIYVAEVIYLATGVIHQAHVQEYVGIPTGKYIPYRAAEWADTSKSIPYFRVDNTNPEMGDIWARGSHTGIYLGKYNGVELYISARNKDDAYGIPTVQYENGIQIKEPPKDDVVFRELCPYNTVTSTISTNC